MDTTLMHRIFKVTLPALLNCRVRAQTHHMATVFEEPQCSPADEKITTLEMEIPPKILRPYSPLRSRNAAHRVLEIFNFESILAVSELHVVIKIINIIFSYLHCTVQYELVHRTQNYNKFCLL